MLDLDLDAADLSLPRIAALAAAGLLTVKVNAGKPLTNAQIDLLIPSWQKANIDSDDDERSRRSGVGVAGNSTKQQRFSRRRNWDDEEDRDGGGAVDPEEREHREVVRSYDMVRESMDEALSAVSDRERLTDDEMQEKVFAVPL